MSTHTNRRRAGIVASVLASALALPLACASAQSTATNDHANGDAGTAGMNNVGTNGNHDTSNQPNGSLEKSHGAWRVGKLDGATVYNGQGDDIGTIDDLLMSSDGKISKVVISVGGFLGIGDKLVEVPFSKLRFEPSQSNSASGQNGGDANHDSSSTLGGLINTGSKHDDAANDGSHHDGQAAMHRNGQDYSVVLPDATKNDLNSMSSFTF